MLDIPCVIFAGGKSSRMGEDKALLPFASFNTLAEYQYSRLSKIFKKVYISTKEREKFDFEAAFIEDESKDIFAPSIGFITVFHKIKEDSFFALSIDSPFVLREQILQLLQADNNEFDAIIAKTGFGIHPMCGIYHRSLEASFKDMLKNNTHKLGLLLKNSKTKYVDFKEEKAFLNLNYPHQYKEAVEIINTSLL